MYVFAAKQEIIPQNKEVTWLKLLRRQKRITKTATETVIISSENNIKEYIAVFFNI